MFLTFSEQSYNRVIIEKSEFGGITSGRTLCPSLSPPLEMSRRASIGLKRGTWIERISMGSGYVDAIDVMVLGSLFAQLGGTIG